MREKKRTSKSQKRIYKKGVRISEEAHKELSKHPESIGKAVDELLTGELPIVDHEVLNRLRDTTHSHKVPLQVVLENIITTFIDSGCKPRGFRKYVMEKNETVIERKKELSVDVEACPELVVITAPDNKEYYNCIRGSVKGTVKIKKMGRFPDEVKNVCEACKFRVNLEKRWTEIQQKDQYGIEEHTYCDRGEEIDREIGKMKCNMQARASGGTWFDMENCFTVNGGKRCPNLRTLPAKAIKRTGVRRRTNL